MAEGPDWRECGWTKLCRSAGLTDAQRQQLETFVVPHPEVKRGAHLFLEDDPLGSLFVIRSGCVKGWVKADSGQEQIVRFYLPGDLLGLNAIGRGRHRSTATALGAASILEIPFDKLQSFADRTPDLNHRIYRMLSEEISSDEQTLSLLVNRTAEERVAGFLLDLARRHGRHEEIAPEFRLQMARHDIANYLGLARETVSLTITRFHNEGLLNVNGRRITVLNTTRLVELGSLRARNVFSEPV
jgi:CRP/FNR family transcriptional regulator